MPEQTYKYSKAVADLIKAGKVSGAGKTPVFERGQSVEITSSLPKRRDLRDAYRNGIPLSFGNKEIEEPERPDVPIEGEDVLLEDEDITLKGDEPLKDYKFDVEKPKTPTVPIEGEDELFEEDITLKGDQPLEDYKLSTKEKFPTPSEAMDKAEKEYKTKQEIREAEYYSILPE